MLLCIQPHSQYFVDILPGLVAPLQGLLFSVRCLHHLTAMLFSSMRIPSPFLPYRLSSRSLPPYLHTGGDFIHILLAGLGRQHLWWACGRAYALSRLIPPTTTYR